MNNQYLIPANTKRGELIFGLFRPIDLMILGIGVSITLIAFLAVNPTSTTVVLLTIAPGLISAFLVLPVPNYHNMMVVISEAIAFLTHRQKYIWKGWCAIYDEEKRKK